MCCGQVVIDCRRAGVTTKKRKAEKKSKRQKATKKNETNDETIFDDPNSFVYER